MSFLHYHYPEDFYVVSSPRSRSGLKSLLLSKYVGFFFASVYTPEEVSQLITYN